MNKPPKSFEEMARERWLGMDSSNATIQSAMLQRIAEGIEVIGKSHSELIAEKTKYQNRWLDEIGHHATTRRQLRSMEHRAAAYKGQVTKLKKQIAKGETSHATD